MAANPVLVAVLCFGLGMVLQACCATVRSLTDDGGKPARSKRRHR